VPGKFPPLKKCWWGTSPGKKNLGGELPPVKILSGGEFPWLKKFSMVKISQKFYISEYCNCKF
jgi:hypothetical protein